MKKSLMLGTMALAAAATVSSAASAKTYQFGFYSPSGTPYCDGLDFTLSGNIASGEHVYDQVYCVYPNAYVGGSSGTAPGVGAGKWIGLAVSNATGDGALQSYTFVFYTNVKALTWVLYAENTDYGVTFEEFNAGTLQKGPPFAHVSPGQKKLGSTIRVGLAHIKK